MLPIKDFFILVDSALVKQEAFCRNASKIEKSELLELRNKAIEVSRRESKHRDVMFRFARLCDRVIL